MAGQSNPLFSLFSPAEMEFLAEDELMEIVPNMRIESLPHQKKSSRMEPPLRLISGDYGPFQPQIVTQVPMWLAVALKKRGKCTIRPPEWMSVECQAKLTNCSSCIFFNKMKETQNLARILEAERDSPREFQQLPFHYVEISRLLFDHARDDIPDIYMVRSLIEDIRDVRFHKVENGLETISARTHAVKKLCTV
ncbi:DNA replication complex GINS protein PSF2-like protein [Drosera capensis]